MGFSCVVGKIPIGTARYPSNGKMHWEQKHTWVDNTCVCVKWQSALEVSALLDWWSSSVGRRGSADTGSLSNMDSISSSDTLLGQYSPSAGLATCMQQCYAMLYVMTRPSTSWYLLNLKQFCTPFGFLGIPKCMRRWGWLTFKKSCSKSLESYTHSQCLRLAIGTNSSVTCMQIILKLKHCTWHASAQHDLNNNALGIDDSNTNVVQQGIMR